MGAKIARQLKAVANVRSDLPMPGKEKGMLVIAAEALAGERRAVLLAKLTHERYRLRTAAAAPRPELSVMLDAAEKIRRIADDAQMTPLATTAGLVCGRLQIACARVDALDTASIQALALAADQVLCSTTDHLASGHDERSGLAVLAITARIAGQ